MNILTGKLARIIFALPFAIFGFGHLTNAGAMAGMLPGWPMPEFFIYLSGVGLILAAISIIIDKKTRLACLLLALLLLLIVLFIHAPGMGAEDPMAAQTAMSMLLKDVGLMGAALILAGISE